MTKHDLVARIAGQTGVEQQQVKAIVQHTLDQIVAVIATRGRLELRLRRVRGLCDAGARQEKPEDWRAGERAGREAGAV